MDVERIIKEIKTIEKGYYMASEMGCSCKEPCKCAGAILSPVIGIALVTEKGIRGSESLLLYYLISSCGELALAEGPVLNAHGDQLEIDIEIDKVKDLLCNEVSY